MSLHLIFVIFLLCRDRIVVPTEGGSKSKILKTACSSGFFASIDSEGHLYTWGQPGCGRLGQNLTFDMDCPSPHPNPRRIVGRMDNANLVDVSLGRYHGLTLSNEGKVYTWGDNRCGQIGLSSSSTMNYDSIHDNYNSMSNTTLATTRILEDEANAITPLIKSLSRTVISTGDSASCFFSLGLSSKQNGESSKHKKEMNMSSSYQEIDFISMQDLSSCIFVPRPVISMQHIVVKSISCGAFHCLCLSVFGRMYSWGRGANGRLGQPISRLKGNRNAGVACLYEDDMSFAEPGAVFFPWVDLETVLQPEAPILDPNHCIVDIAAGLSHSLAITATGQVFSWGSGSYGRLGHGDHCDEALPRSITCLFDSEVKVVSCSAGAAHSMFLSDGGQLFGCGLDSSCQVDSLPLVSATSVSPGSSVVDQISVVFPLPILVKSQSSPPSETLSPGGGTTDGSALDHFGEVVTRVVCGDYHTIAVAHTGTVYGWGLGFTIGTSINRKNGNNISGKNTAEKFQKHVAQVEEGEESATTIDTGIPAIRGLASAMGGHNKSILQSATIGLDRLCKAKTSVDDFIFISCGGNCTMINVHS